MEPGVCVCVQVCLCEYCVYLQGKSTTFCDAFMLLTFTVETQQTHSSFWNPDTFSFIFIHHQVLRIKLLKNEREEEKKKEWVQTDTLGKKKRRDQIKDSDGYIHINVCGV